MNDRDRALRFSEQAGYMGAAPWLEFLIVEFAAARAAERERCEKACDEVAARHQRNDHSEVYLYSSQAAEECADGIRAMKEPTP